MSGGLRGQTTLDFAIGMGVFLLAVGAVFAVIPALVGPSVGHQVAESTAVDRAADELVRDELAGPSHPYVLNVTATKSFFDGTTANARHRLAFDDRVGLNVTLSNATSRRSVGPATPNRTDSVYTAWRVVTVGGERHDLRVRIW